MAVFEGLSALLTSKVGATVAGVALATGAVGATGSLPEDVQASFDSTFGIERAEQAQADAEERQADAEEEAVEAEEQAAEAEANADEVLGTLSGDEEVTPGSEEFGEAVSDNAREGGADFGADVASSASDGNSDDGQEAAAEGQANGEASSDADEASAEGEARAEAGADNGEDGQDVADDYRPEDPESAGDENRPSN